MGILVITTGGTIGALPYYEFNYSMEFVSTMPPPGQDLVRDALEKFSNVAQIRCVSFEPRDSKLIDDAYRSQLLAILGTAPENKILLTHGTDTLLQTAEFFYRQTEINPALANKSILITGAMVPLANGPTSDGYLNLKFSIEQLETLPASSIKEKNNIYIVLCDYERPDDSKSAWLPHLYPYQPGRYKKSYAEDRRYSRLQRVKEND